MRDILNDIKREMGYSNLDSADLQEMADQYLDLDAEDFEQMDTAEYVDFLDFVDAAENAEARKRGHRPPGKQRRPKGVSRGQFGVRRKNKLAAIGSDGKYTKKNTVSEKKPVFGTPSYINELMTRSKGDLNITVTRQSVNIVGVLLPYILFGLNGFQSSYISTIKSYLPSGTTMAASIDAATGDVILTYTAPGPLVDTVRMSLTGSEISYSEFLQNMNQNYFKSMYIRQEYPDDANLLVGKSQTIRYGLLSALGMKNTNTLLPRARSLTSDFQKTIVNLFVPEQKITADFSFVQNIPAVANYTIAWDVFMSDRVNLNNV